jgi:hypothetical protein
VSAEWGASDTEKEKHTTPSDSDKSKSKNKNLQFFQAIMPWTDETSRWKKRKSK